MNRQIWVFFLSITSWTGLLSQYYSDFSLSQWNLNGEWKGQTSHFVHEDGKLRLKGVPEGNSRIYTSFDLTSSHSWEAWIWLDFNPSVVNQLRIYLWSKTSDLDLADAVYVVLGENGTTDVLRLYQRNQRVDKLLGSITQFSLGIRPVLRFRATYTAPGIWTLQADCNGNRIFVDDLVATSMDIETGSAVYGIECRYTATRANRFYFDDIFIGPSALDTIPPVVISSKVSSNIVEIVFDELIEESSIKKGLDVVSEESIDSLVFYPSKSTVHLYSDTDFKEQQELQVNLKGIRDVSANSLDTVLNLVVPSRPAVNEVLINEILFNPIDQGVDFIEVINVSDKYIDVGGLEIMNSQNGQMTHVEEQIVLAKSEIMAMCSDVSVLTNQYPNSSEGHIYKNALPNFNNDQGNITLQLGTTVIDEMDYSDDMHHPYLVREEGVSLERISVARSSMEQTNWTSAAENAGFATPGMPNSTAFQQSEVHNFKLARNIFSPDGDNYEDVVVLDYVMKYPDFIVGMSIYNEGGSLVRKVHEAMSMGSTGRLQWDGKNNEGEVLPMGIYLLVLKGISPRGLTFTHKETVVLAYKL